ncbi:hypothetical protein HXX76_011472 [Chlamydomonas incerta]|uniref:Uncharacterized protein n=1 Tax=Chlamydomonas incerta TaxID=51695 RepID=A0A835VXK2_CHLIN|nr:hypothetical protein HXX76_011472 [Chlamydomonas incerta]|eukprot:KAG2428771.1 hypothetical protein HXX76_011472 [Chlamydomonas incerta]
MSRRWRSGWRSKREFPILFLGLDAAGKSTVLYGLKAGEVVSTVPTIGFNLETIEHKGFKINCWDVGGCDKIRPLWRHFTDGCAALVFVVDANDRERLAGARQALEDVLREVASGVPVLVLANKQDLPNALPAAEMARLMWLTPPPPSPRQQHHRNPNLDGQATCMAAGDPGTPPVPGGQGGGDDGGGSASAAVAVGYEMSRGERSFRELMSRHPVHVQPTCALKLFGVFEGFDWLAGAVDCARQARGAATGDVNSGSGAGAGSSLSLLRAALPGWRSREQDRQRQARRQQQQQSATPVSADDTRGAPDANGKAVGIPTSASVTAATTTTNRGGGGGGGGGGGPVLPSAEERLSGWLAEPVAAEDTDDAFLAALEACEPGVRWDHFGHLRLAWLYLVRYGRSEGKRRIFEAVQRYIQHGVAGGGGRTFHASMTFFWMHMVHFALASSELHTPMVRASFRAFLIANPHLADGGLFLHHYSRARMLQDPAARTSVLLPDLQPLPSLVTDVEARKREQARERRMAVAAAAVAGIGACGAARLLTRAAGVAAGWRVRGGRSGGASHTMRLDNDGVLGRRSSTNDSSRSTSSAGSGGLCSGGRLEAAGAPGHGSHHRLPATAVAAVRDEDLLAAVLQHLPRRTAATAAAAGLGQPRASSGMHCQGPVGSADAGGLRHSDQHAGGADVAHQGGGGSWPPPPLSGWGSDTLPRLAYAAIKHHGYTRACELLQAAAAAAATTHGLSLEETSSSNTGTAGPPSASAEAVDAARAATQLHMERASDHGSLMGMASSQLEAVVRETARSMAAHLPAVMPPPPAGKGSRSQGLGDGKPGVGIASVQGDCSGDEEWLDVGDSESWGAEVACGSDAESGPPEASLDVELETLVGSHRVPLVRAALPQYRMLFVSG